MSARIVVLDSEPMVRSAITASLQHGGYTVEPIETVELAIQIIKQAPPDLLLTNVYLPGMTGHRAMELLKGICPELRVLMTINASPSRTAASCSCRIRATA